MAMLVRGFASLFLQAYSEAVVYEPFDGTQKAPSRKGTTPTNVSSSRMSPRAP